MPSEAGMGLIGEFKTFDSSPGTSITMVCAQDKNHGSIPQRPYLFTSISRDLFRKATVLHIK